MRNIIVKAQAKINLSLDVLRKRQDGYHDVKMIMQLINLHDIVELTKISKGIKVVCRNSYIPEGKGNIAYKAAAVLKEMFGFEGVKIYIDKMIPVAAGLGGGSADAAAVLYGINKLFSLGLSEEELMKIGKSIGADVPFCIKGGTAIAEGIGDIITPVKPLPKVFIVLVKPNFGVSTPWVYQNLDLTGIKRRPDTEKLISYIEAGDIKNVAENMVNVLEEVTVERYPEIENIKRSLMEHGALGSMMSGSGPTVFGIFDSQEKAEHAFNKHKKKGQKSILTSS